MNDDYQKGYREGFQDGWNARDKASKAVPTVPVNAFTQEIKCPTCGMVWKGAMGYVCPNMKCPIQPRVTSWAKS